VQQGARVGLEPPYLAPSRNVVIERMKAGYPSSRSTARDSPGPDRRGGALRKTLERGLRLFRGGLQEQRGHLGRGAFRLHDTYGFPLELTRELARERGLGVNEEEFNAVDGASAHAFRGAISRTTSGQPSFRPARRLSQRVRGYEKTEVLTQIGALEEVGEGLSSRSCASRFLSEGGGQVTDAGWIERDDGSGIRAELREAYRLRKISAAPRGRWISGR